MLIEAALLEAGIRFIADTGAGVGNASRLDFSLPDYGIEIEVKRFHSLRIAEQMSRAPNVIAAQGEVAVRFLADAIRALGNE